MLFLLNLSTPSGTSGTNGRRVRTHPSKTSPQVFHLFAMISTRKAQYLGDDDVDDGGVVSHADVVEKPRENLLLERRRVVLLRHPAPHHYSRQRRRGRHAVLFPHVHAAEHLVCVPFHVCRFVLFPPCTGRQRQGGGDKHLSSFNIAVLLLLSPRGVTLHDSCQDRPKPTPTPTPTHQLQHPPKTKK